jgi:hypothetical protein
VTLVKTCTACSQFVFNSNKVGGSQTQFYQYLSLAPRLFDGTRSNAPTSVLCGLASGLFGLGAQELFFLLGVIILWFFVGRAIDHTTRRQGSFGPKAWVAKSTIDVLLMLLATLVLLVGVTPILDTRGFTNPIGARAAAFLQSLAQERRTVLNCVEKGRASPS